MRVMPHLYCIAGVNLLINSKDLYLSKEMQDFLIDDGKADVTISVCEENFSPILEGKQILVNDQLVISEYEDFFLVKYMGISNVSCYTVSKVKKEAFIFIGREYKESELTDIIGDEGNLMTELMYAIRDSFFFYLQMLGRVVVHSASIIYENKAWLFSASSGTGKSTHVSLWKKAGYSIQDLNGDLAACFIDDSGKVMAAGLPWCGTSGIYTNQIVPLGGIFFLKRSNTNRVETMSDVEGILHIIARLTTPNWTKELATINADIAQNIAPKINLFRLYCNMEQSAAEVVKEYIDEIIST